MLFLAATQSNYEMARYLKTTKVEIDPQKKKLQALVEHAQNSGGRVTGSMVRPYWEGLQGESLKSFDFPKIVSIEINEASVEAYQLSLVF